jgi:P-type Mg2+ transporter
VIRTRRVPFLRSHPSLPMLLVPTSCALIGAVLPFTPLSHVLGFTSLPPLYFLMLLAMIVTYLALVELVKSVFYAAHPGAFAKPLSTDPQRRERRVFRRMGHFVLHGPGGSGGHGSRPGVRVTQPQGGDATGADAALP